MTTPTIILVHGASATPKSWDKTIASIGPKAHCIAVDLAAFDNIPDMAAHILGPVTAGIKEFTICGLSMGGYVALEVARQNPARVSKLILANTSARADTPQRVQERLLRLAETEEEFIARLHDPELPARLLSIKSASNPEVVAEFVNDMIAAGPEVSKRHALACMNRRASLDVLPALKMPILVIGGDEDKLIPLDHQREIVALAPNAKLEIISDCGHGTAYEHPEAIAKLVRDFALPAISAKALPVAGVPKLPGLGA